MLDTQTLDGSYRMTAFCESLERALEEFFSWVKENGVVPDDIWYSELFECDPEGYEDPKRVCCFDLTTQDKAEIIPKADGVSPFAFRARPIKGFIKRIKKN